MEASDVLTYLCPLGPWVCSSRTTSASENATASSLAQERLAETTQNIYAYDHDKEHHGKHGHESNARREVVGPVCLKQKSANLVSQNETGQMLD